MGIINSTPDSFYTNSRAKDVQECLRIAEKMISEGADILDIGGYSSRPGAEDISVEEELFRVMPCLEAIRNRFGNILISVDTFRSHVAREAMELGADIINDITAGNGDQLMFPTLKGTNINYIMMHMRGTPRTMQQNTNYGDLIADIKSYFQERIESAKANGINNIIIDPGFGFSKTLEQNYLLMKELDCFIDFGYPLLIGVSRKSMIYKLLETDPENSLTGTTALNMAALLKGAQILRVHDVLAAKQVVTLATKINC